MSAAKKAGPLVLPLAGMTWEVIAYSYIELQS
jgi:hypothetical protein